MGYLQDGEWHEQRRRRRTRRTGASTGRRACYRNWVTRDGAPGPSGRGGFAGGERALPPLRLARLPLGAPDADLPRAQGPRAARQRRRGASRSSARTAGPSPPTSRARPATGCSARRFLREVYLASDPQATGRVTVPVLWDKATRHHRLERVRRDHPDVQLGLRRDHRQRASTSTPSRCGPRSTRSTRGSTPGSTTGSTAPASPAPRRPTTRPRRRSSRRSTGSRSGWRGGATWWATALTEADWRLATTLFRFDPVYHGHFKCNRAGSSTIPNLWALRARALPGARRRRHGELRPHRQPLLHQPRVDQPERGSCRSARRSTGGSRTAGRGAPPPEPPALPGGSSRADAAGRGLRPPARSRDRLRPRGISGEGAMTGKTS